MTLLLIGLLGGLITGISPCILPVLPVVFLGGASTDPDTDARRSRARPFLVVGGLTLSFAVFTLFGTLVLTLLHLPTDLIRWLGIAALVILGVALIVPAVERIIERPFARIRQREVKTDRGGFVLGLALGAVFVPCAGPVLAAIALAGATGDIGWNTVGLTLAFALGCAIPLLVFALAGRQVLTRVQAFRRHYRVVRIVSGSVMIALAVALAFNLSDVIQRTIPNYTEAIGNSLEGGVAQAEGSTDATTGSASAALTNCQTEAYYGENSLEDCGAAPELSQINAWLNTPGGASVSLASLKGKVVLVDFWAYSCINCQRELPHVEAWYQAYADAGFEVIGVHTPEYAFERETANVQAGADRLGLTFPLAIDNQYGTWHAYQNSSWPATYLIDATGQIRHISVGEGDYANEEGYIRQLLTAANPQVVLPASTNVADDTPRDAQQSPETYLGSARAQQYVGGGYSDGTSTFTFPDQLTRYSFGLAGTWTVDAESITAGDGAQIELNYHAMNVYLDVGGTGTLTVSQDGTATQTIDVSGAPNIYTVISNSSAQAGTVTISLSPGLSAYSFTFG